MYNCVSIWAPNQVEWPHSIRSQLDVESLKRPKHAVHNECLGTLLMTRIKIVFNSHDRSITCIIQLTFQIYGYVYKCRIRLSIHRIPLCEKHAVYMVMCCTNSCRYIHVLCPSVQY